MNNWIIRILVAVGLFISVNTANAIEIDRGNATTVCSHHGGTKTINASGATGCVWCGTKKCTYIFCDKNGCSQTTLIGKHPPKGVGKGGVATPIGKPVKTPPPSNGKAGPSKPIDTRPIGATPGGGGGGKLK